MEKEIICIVCPKGCKINARTRSGSAGVSPDATQSQTEGVGFGTEGTGTVYEITGHSCTRGYEYALSECTNPVRTLTTTARLLYDDTDRTIGPGRAGNSGSPDNSDIPDGALETDGTRRTVGIIPVLVPVKSSAPLPKNLLKECVKVVNSVTVRPPIRIGDVVVRDILATGTDIIATANITGEECKWRSGSSSRSTRGLQAQGQSSSTASVEK